MFAQFKNPFSLSHPSKNAELAEIRDDEAA